MYFLQFQDNIGGHVVVLGCVWDFFVVVGLGFVFFKVVVSSEVETNKSFPSLGLVKKRHYHLSEGK